jgi:hypothetical protein
MPKRDEITSPYQPDVAAVRAWLEKMIASMRLGADGHPERGRPGEVGLHGLAGAMLLHEEDLLRRPLQRAPHPEPALEGPQVAEVVDLGPLLHKVLEQRLGLELRRVLEARLDLTPVLGERLGRVAREYSYDFEGVHVVKRERSWYAEGGDGLRTTGFLRRATLGSGFRAPCKGEPADTSRSTVQAKPLHATEPLAESSRGRGRRVRRAARAKAPGGP